MSRIPIWGCPGSIKKGCPPWAGKPSVLWQMRMCPAGKGTGHHQSCGQHGEGGQALRAAGASADFAVGNAPTALVRIYELIEEGLAVPALVIGVPVGFVNVVQSKELILTLKDTPYIVARGRKGGSNVAAAICNALLYQIPV